MKPGVSVLSVDVDDVGNAADWFRAWLVFVLVAVLAWPAFFFLKTRALLMRGRS